ncbi:MAG: cupin domain-containing protein [Betaproteobacteria bacterium]|nr:MAG: cupin domain-containing protein [Betaproteobacteria bacterium]
MSRYLVRQQDVRPYSPANHTGTRNFRLIGPETVGARQLEVIVGELERGKGALPHSHKGIEQVCYLLEGNAHVEVGGQKFEMKPGEACFFPADTVHLLIVTSERAKVLVIYSCAVCGWWISRCSCRGRSPRRSSPTSAPR